MCKQRSVTAKDLIAEKRLVQSALPSVEAILSKLQQKNPLRLVYGETYDAYGLTLDSLRYYFFIALLQDLLRKEGFKASASVIVGDLHSVKNKIVKDKDILLASTDLRRDFVQKIITIYGLAIEPVLMSRLFDEPDFKQRLSDITPIFQRSEELKAIAKKTVLVNRRAQEEKAGFQYTLEEVALITGFDVKIGPPRETHYDQLARLLGNEVGNNDLCGLYLTPTYPLGLGFDYFVTHPEVEEYGLTPYKAGSNRLQDNRITLGVSTAEQCKKLINDSFVAANPKLPNPVFDVYLIAQMAGHFLHGEDFMVDEDLAKDAQALKDAAYEKLMANVYKPLGLLT